MPPFDFDLPNYKELGIALTKAIRTYPVDDTPLPELQPVVQPVDDITLSLAEIGEDIKLLSGLSADKKSQPTTTHSHS